MRGLERLAAALSFVAGGLHLLAGPQHVEEWWAYGLFFFGSAAVQVAYGLVLLTQGVEGWGGWAGVRRRVYLVGIAITAAILLLWLVSRLVGVPVGPEAFEPEGVGPLDLTSKAVELALVGVLAWLTALASGDASRGPPARLPGRPPGRP